MVCNSCMNRLQNNERDTQGMRTTKQLTKNESVKKRILIVDDERDCGFCIKIVLENCGFDVDFFMKPLEALKDFKPGSYDLTILDIKMPEINGFELYSQFKSKDAKNRTIFLTAVNNVEAYNTQLSEVYPKLGERLFVKKPVSNKDLLEHVYSIMN